MTDEEQSGSLADQAAAWVPPWQRVTQQPSSERPTPRAPEPDEDEQRPETDLSEPGPGDEVEDDEQRPETDLAVPRPGDEVEDDEQRPETDLAVPGPGEEVSGDEVADEAPVSGRPDNLVGALEAILLVVDEPVPTDVLSEVLDVPLEETYEALETLASTYAADARGFDLRRAAGGWRLYTRSEYAAYVERFVLDGQSVRLTQAALETLAVIAYQQPVTRSRMWAIRGVNCDGVVRTLANRGLIEECGTQAESGAFLYRTTPLFLEKLGLDSLDELPPLAPFLPDDVNGFVDA